MYSFTASYNELLENMSANNKVSTKIEIAKTELEAKTNMRLNEFKCETVSLINIQLSDLRVKFLFIDQK